MLKISLLSVMLTSTCVSATSLEAYCSNTRKDVDNHADALLEDGGPKSRVSGATVIQKWDVVCQQ